MNWLPPRACWVAAGDFLVQAIMLLLFVAFAVSAVVKVRDIHVRQGWAYWWNWHREDAKGLLVVAALLAAVLAVASVTLYVSAQAVCAWHRFVH